MHHAVAVAVAVAVHIRADARPHPGLAILWNSTLALKDVRIEGDEDAPEIVVLFSAATHPGCVFGFRVDLSATVAEPPDFLARVILTNIEETVEAVDLGLPPCTPGEVTWIPDDPIDEGG